MGCQKCKKDKNIQNEQNGQQDNEKTCSTCKKNFIKFLPTVGLSLIFFSSAVYGLITFIKDMIELFSK